MVPKRQKIVAATPVGPVIDSLLTDLLDHPRAKAHRLWPLWRQAVGGELASHTELVRLRAGTLTVRVDSPVWADQLRFMKPDILLKLAEQPLPQPVKDIVFQQGSLRNRSFAPGPKPVTPLPPVTAVDAERAEALAATVENEELKRALAKLVRTYLTAQRLDGTAS